MRILTLLLTLTNAFWLGGLATLFLLTGSIRRQDPGAATRAAPHIFAAFETYHLILAGITLLLIVAMGLFFTFTLVGKALRATAFNRTGARLIGFSPNRAGFLTFTFAAFLGTLSGVLIAPVVTIYYDSGFVIGLKGFVAAIVGGLASYPLTALGAVLVGVLEAFSSFWASGYKEAIVFTLVIPVLIWLSLTGSHHEEEE